jgi:transposase
MAKPYSIDLRERVVAAVEAGGMSRRKAAWQFAVGISFLGYQFRPRRVANSQRTEFSVGTPQRSVPERSSPFGQRSGA